VSSPLPARSRARSGATLSRREHARRRRVYARRRAGALAIAVLLVGAAVAGISALTHHPAASADDLPGSVVPALEEGVATAASTTIDSLRDTALTSARRVLARYSDASHETEKALFEAAATLESAGPAEIADALASTASARAAVIADARAYRASLVKDSAATNSQPTGGDVDSQLSYLMDHVFDYNSAQWGDYNPYGGDCTNFASQGLLARGWTIDDTWYSHGGMWTASKPWIATAAMASYFDGLGLSYSTQDDLDRVRVGDIGLFDWGETGAGYDHTMTVSKVTYTPDGPVIFFVSHNHDGKYRELQETLYTEHTDSTVRIYHIP
jgi:hypothetical protein